MQAKINFNYADRQLNLRNKQAIKLSVVDLFSKENQPLEHLDYIFCSDDFLLEINKSFLNHDYYTDIITFDLREKKHLPITGEIYISIDRVKENAQIQKTSFFEEALRVIYHGALHLCGYKDKNKTQEKEMREKEQYYIDLFHSSST